MAQDTVEYQGVGVERKQLHSVRPFGGPWTERKLQVLKKYLEIYRKIFSRNEKARFFNTIYLDAFAGTGNWIAQNSEHQTSLFLSGDTDSMNYAKGSVRVALDLDNPFDEYVFIEKNATFAAELETIIDEYPEQSDRVNILQGDANQKIIKYVDSVNWGKNRAVVFLDPWGMQVEWATIEKLGATKAVDLWYLFPLGQGVNRLLTRANMPNGKNADRLTRIFGSDEWMNEFYIENHQIDLFSGNPGFLKSANFSCISKFIINRLNTAFYATSNTPIILVNSKNNPIFLLLFAAANERGSIPALSIAKYLAREK